MSVQLGCPHATSSGKGDRGGAPRWRILVTDDNPAIHADFDKILRQRDKSTAGLASLEASLFEQESESVTAAATLGSFDLDFASQGEEALAKVRAAHEQGRPYALVFMDVRMPPGWDGVRTTQEILALDEQVHVVICTAYSDYDWESMQRRFGGSERVLVLKKPFDTVEIRQLAHTLTRKWSLACELRRQLEALDERVRERTAELERAREQLQRELEERERMEVELRQAHKLEAVGQLASGIAHEINTPMQYIGDNVRFLRDAFGDLMGVMAAYAELRDAAVREQVLEGPRERVREVEERADVAFVCEEVEPAIDQTLEGVEHVTGIVRALKEFAHPGEGELQEADLRKALDNALVLGRNAYKLVADVETEYEELPPVRCRLAELNQVFLNLIVNAAHAVEDKVGSSGERGTIRIRARQEDAFVHVEIADSGCGIPAAIRERVFEPFFTTKGVGRGTGQGLAIAYRIVVTGHGGELWFDTEPGEGTTFHIRLPIDGPHARPEE